MDALHTIFFAALAIMLAVNFLLAFRFRSSVPLLYSGALLCVAVIVWFNSMPARAFVPHETRALIIAGAGSGAAACAVFFWDRLMLLKVHTPRARFAVFGAGGLVFLSGVAILLPGVPASQVESIQQLLSLTLFPAVALTAIHTLRAGFRPAVYSTIGILFFLAFGAAHVAHSRHWLPAGFFSERFLLIGFLGDFVWFVFSLAARASILGRESPAASENENIRSYQAKYTRKKYERSKLGAIDTDRLARSLRQFMEVDRCYCDEDLTLDQLATLCAVSRHELSEFLNDRLGVNFNRYVNDYRVREVLERLVSEPDRTILDIAFSSGFNSKTRFNTEFKRVTGQTPSEYRQSAPRPAGQ